jgi:AcrR family transcriptional regulator
VPSDNPPLAASSVPAATLPLSLRRTPNQTRARETMDAILQAAAAEIERDGLDRLTTKRIASAAGVSVGGLYEYFPNKEAVVFALVKQWLDRIYQALDDLHPRQGGCPDIMSYLSRALEQMITLYRDQPGLGSLVTITASMPQVHDAVREHDSRSAAATASALSAFVPGADPALVLSTARSLAIFGHETLSEALVRKAPDADALIENYRVCAFALVSRLFVAAGVAR